MIFEKETLKQFFREFFSLHGISVMNNFNSDDLWTAHLTSDISRFFENRSHLRLCFDRNLLPLHPDFSCVTIGSPILTQIKEAFNESRFYTCGFVKIDLSQWAFRTGIPGHLTFKSCTARHRERRVLYKGLSRFNFKLIITTDEKKEELFPVLVDTSTGKMANTLLLRLKDVEMADAPTVEGKVLPGKPFHDIREKAYQTAEIKIQPLINVIEAELSERTGDELHSAEEFYRNEYQNLLKDKSITAEEFDRNRQKCLDEIKKRYQVSFELCLLNVVSYYVPILRNVLEISKNGSVFNFASDYDLFQEKYEDIMCPKCGRPSVELHCCDDHGLHCKDDLWLCGRCGRERCSSCSGVVCAVSSCLKKICGQCADTCPSCKRTECREHRELCKGCGRECCPECSTISDREQKVFCGSCIAECSECRKTVYKANTARCQLCGATVCPVCGIKACASCGAQVCSACAEKTKDGRALCKNCIGFCRSCGGGYAKTELSSCSIGGEALCPGCIVEKCHQEGCSYNVLCNTHSAHCNVCGQLYCSVHISRCALCGGTLCRDHSPLCESCRSVTCPDHFVSCSKCGRKLCSACAGHTFNKCHRDGNVLCPDHTAVCAICGSHSCPEHLRPCPHCGEESCREHTVFCALCGSEHCDHCAGREFIICRRDGAKVCQACQRTCATCNNTYCSKDIRNCPCCVAPTCIEHFGECTGCGVKVCPSCMDNARHLCQACRSLSPVDAESDIVKIFLKENREKLPELTRSGKWHHGKGREYQVIQGSNLTSMLYCAVHPETLKIVEFRKKGLIDRIKRMFGV